MRILFITATRIGDAVMSTGVLDALVERYPAARFTVACGPLAASLFAAVPRLDRVIVVTKQPWDRHWFDLWRILRPISWDIVVDLRRSLIAYTLKAGARHVLGPADPKRHRVETLPAVIGIDGPRDPRVFTAPRHAEAAARLIPVGSRVLALGPVASLATKTWPAARFAALARTITASGQPCADWRVAAFGGPGDDVAADTVLAALPPERAIRIVAQPDLLTVYAALARCAAFVGNDSGLSHLAAAAGIPTLAVFGATDPARYAPWGRRCAVVRSPDPHDLASLDTLPVAQALARLLEQPASPEYAGPVSDVGSA